MARDFLASLFLRRGNTALDMIEAMVAWIVVALVAVAMAETLVLVSLLIDHWSSP